MTYWKGGRGGRVGQNHIVLLRYVWEQMCKLILVYLEIHLRNVYHYSVLKGLGQNHIIIFILLGYVWEHTLYLEYVSSCFVDRCLSFCSWPSCCVFFDLQILVTFKLCFLVYTYSRYHSEIKVYTMRSNFLTVHLRLILDQQAKLGFHSALSLKLQPVDRHCTPHWHIILIPSKP